MENADLLNRNRLQKIICIFFVLATSVSASAQVYGTVDGGVYQVPSTSPFIEQQDDLLHDIGYRVQERDIQAPFVISNEAREIFEKNKALRSNMPVAMPATFAPMVRTIYSYIQKLEDKRSIAVKDKKGQPVKDKDGKPLMKRVSYEQANGITNWNMAIKITRLAFCFSTEPKGVAAQIHEESSFNRNKPSSTGAVGFTQLTSVAIDEVNDQLGNRGIKGANLTNVPYLAQAIHCYTGGRAFQPMFLAGVIPRGKTVEDDSKLRTKAKAWIMADIDRDLIYGQIALKVLLADARDSGVVGEAAYLRAFKMYNGDPRQKARYARDIVNTMKKI